MKPVEEILRKMKTLKITGAAPGGIADVCYDSRKAKKGGVFVAIRGARMDGSDYILDAVKRGATTVIAERDPGLRLPRRVTLVLVPDSREALARISDYFYDSPSEKLRVMGVTGTNGKTTVSYLVESILKADGRRVGRIGTTGYELLGERLEAITTTPESLDLQRMTRELVDGGGEYLALEVSSHALTQRRVDMMRFRAAIFTNLTQDHLDYHQTMEDYFAAKARLFTESGPENAVVNMDDPWATRLITMTAANIITYGVREPAEITAEGVSIQAGGISMKVKTPFGPIPVRSRLTGKHNVYNILAAVGATLPEGASPEVIAEGVENLAAVPGRFEPVSLGQPFTVIVDYAHTDDALANVLRTARSLAEGRVITVFGCGGDRDRAKRPLMGTAAWDSSDVVIVTSDNPRTEDPEAIIRDILDGIRKEDNPAGRLEVIPDRREAIRAAVGLAEPGDLVLIAGKGHEDYQIVGTKKHHFDDREEAAAAVRESYGQV